MFCKDKTLQNSKAFTLSGARINL